jgi:predicted nucleic acid-binding protein
MKLIDTDIAIDHFHGNQSARKFFEQALVSGEPLYISVVTLTELLAGMRSGEEEITEKLLSLFTVIDVDNAIGRKAGEYLRQYSRSHKLDLGDALIAATAAIMGAELATRNTKHYPMDDIQINPPYERGRK